MVFEESWFYFQTIIIIITNIDCILMGRPRQIIAGPLQESSEATRMTRSDAGSRSTGRDRTRSRSEERKHRLHHRLNFLKETRRSSSAPP